MRRLLIAFIVVGAGIVPAPTLAYTSPGSPTGYINDFAHVLSTETSRALEAELAAFDATTSNQIAVAIVPSMDGDYIENYAVKLFEGWKIGTASHDNGVLLVVAVAEHKLRIEVGYGLEGALPDSIAQRILDEEMTPRLKKQDYDGAVTAAVHAIEAATQGEYTAAPTATLHTGGLSSDAFGILAFIFVFVFQFLASILARSKSWWAGGILGVLAGLAAGWYIALPGILIYMVAALFGIFGLILDFLVSNTYLDHASRGVTPPWWTGGGGFGGGSSSGGFGGFGGGGSGGGGASGGW